jgi:hypothetical protein
MLMSGRFRRRFWIALTGLLALITYFVRDWIELISRWAPDQHDGSVELLIVLGVISGLAVAALVREARLHD